MVSLGGITKRYSSRRPFQDPLSGNIWNLFNSKSLKYCNGNSTLNPIKLKNISSAKQPKFFAIILTLFNKQSLVMNWLLY